jgi:hypothetical protein
MGDPPVTAQGLRTVISQIASAVEALKNACDSDPLAADPIRLIARQLLVLHRLADKLPAGECDVPDR